MDIVCVHQGGDGIFLSNAAQHQPLLFGQVLTGAPLGHMEGNLLIGLPDLFGIGPARRTMLPIANGLGFDVVQIPTSGEVCGGGDEQKHPARQ